MGSEDISAPGWDAIDNALKPLYHDQLPKHYGTLISHDLGGPDPLRGISAYKRLGPIPHWHFITYGFSELYAKSSNNKAVSGWGFELTLRLRADPSSDEPPMWVLNFLQNIARYVFKSGRVFNCGDYMNVNGPIAAGADTQICSVAFVQDPEMPPIETPNGRLQFIQLVGITNNEELAIKQWATLKALAVFQQKLPLLITDLDRHSLLSEPEVKRLLAEGTAADGSNTGALFIDQLSWVEECRLLRSPLIKITLGARQVRELVSLLPYRLPYRRPFELLGQQCQIVMNPSENNGYQHEAGTLRLALSSQTAKELVERLAQKEGSYELLTFPDLRIHVKKTFIKDQLGNVIETIG